MNLRVALERAERAESKGGSILAVLISGIYFTRKVIDRTSTALISILITRNPLRIQFNLIQLQHFPNYGRPPRLECILAQEPQPCSSQLSHYLPRTYFFHTMFTGLIEHIASVSKIDNRNQDGYDLVFSQAAAILDDVAVGDSICVNGACLTVTEFDREAEGGWFRVGLANETLNRTNLGE